MAWFRARVVLAGLLMFTAAAPTLALPQPAPAATTAPAASPGSAPAPAASTAAPGTPSAATPATSPAADAPLEADGLTARALRDISRWVDGLGGQLDQVKGAAMSLPALFAGAVHDAAGPHRGLLLRLLGSLAGVFALGLALEWLLFRMLRRPRAALVAHAEAADRADAERRAEQARHAAKEAQQANTSTQPAAVEPAAPAGDVALVVSHRDGVQQVEAVPVAAGDGGSGGGAASSPVAEAQEAAPVQPPRATQDDSSGTHLRTLRHLPFAIASLVLDLLPIALFFVAAGLLLRALAPEASRTFELATGFIDAYVTVRVGMALLRLLVSPVGHGLRLLSLGHVTAMAVTRWGRRILVIGAFGIALADAIGRVGGGASERAALIKLVSLLVHVCVVILIFRIRKQVAAHIRARPGAEGAFASTRNWLAEIWAFAAAVLVMALWVVWALGVEDGFPKLLHFLGTTAAVVVVTRIVSVLVLGLVGRAFSPAAPGKDAKGDPVPVPAAARIDIHRYYPLARAVVTFVMTLCALIALLQVWGVDALSWFSRGTLGRSVASAALTILVAAVIAIVVWELTNAGINRRLDRWVDQGDLVRAARLRTLVPMLRTCLLVVMVLIVGLTALSQIGVNTAPLLAGASIVGVALGFGSQKLVQDFITGIFLLMENAMQVGDWVTVAGISGSVEYLSIRTVRLRGGDGSLYIVPFSSVTTVNNTNRGIGNAALRISLDYDADVSRAIDELKKLGADLRVDPAFKDLILADIEVWGVDAVDGSMFTLAGQIRCSDKGRWGVQRELNRRILERFRDIGIPVANPQATVLVTGPETTVAQTEDASAQGG